MKEAPPPQFWGAGVGPSPPPATGGAQTSGSERLSSSRCGRRGGSFFLLLALVLLTGAAPVKHRAPIAPGTIAPDFALPTVDGAITHSAGYRGKTLVLNFCAFWCDTWKAEWPHLTDLAGEEDTSNFQLVVVSVDGTRVPQFRRGLAQLRQDGMPPPFPVLLDPGGRVSGSYGIAHVPTVVVIDASGRVRFVTEGYPGNAVLLHQVRTLQNEQIQNHPSPFGRRG